jgi:trk system potassium uptake protein TrkA
LSRDVSIIELPAPQQFLGRTLRQLELRPRYGLTLIAIKRRAPDGGLVTTIVPDADEVIRPGDVLALLGSNDRLTGLDRILAQ